MPDVPPRGRELLPLARELLRGFDAPVDRFAADLRGALDLRVLLDLAAVPDLRAADDRLAPADEDFARDAGFFAPVERELFDAPLLERLAVEREPDALRVPLDLRELAPVEDPELVLPLDTSVGDHLPDITRCAASATASAMIEPSLVALETTLLAARSAVSAASNPASRILLRAEGLALIAAAAAARPAASISLLIAALASLSTVALFEAERDADERERDGDDLEREELLRADFAIALSPWCEERHFKAVPVP